jgi:O-antigen/teichoic acid export membrane protein
MRAVPLHALTLAARALSSSVLVALAARSLGPAAFGTFAAVLAVVLMGAAVSDLGSSARVAFEAARAPERARTLLTYGLVASALGGVSMVAVAAGLLRVTGVEGSYAVLGILAIAELFLTKLAEIPARIRQGQRSSGLLAALILSQSASRLALGVALYGTTLRTSPEAWATVSALGSLVSVIVVWWLAQGVECKPAELPLNALSVEIRRGLPYVAGNVSKTVYTNSDRFILERLSTPRIAGMYAAGYPVVEACMFVVRADLQSSLARLFSLARDHEPSARGFAWKRIRLGFLASMVLAGGAYLVAPLVLPVVLGDGYEETSTIVRVLVWAAPLQVISGWLGELLTATGHQAKRAKAMAGGAVFNVVLTVASVPTLGWRGAAFATLVTEFAVAAYLVRQSGGFAKPSSSHNA